MIRKSAQFEHARELRKRGFTYAEVAKIVDVSKSTISQWFSRETWSQSVTESNKKRSAKENSKRISLLNTARGNQYKKLYAEAERSAVTEFKHYKNNPLFIAGLMLYVSIGDTKSPNLIRMADARPELHALLIRFLAEYLGIPREKIRFWLTFYPPHKPLIATRHWSKKLHIPISQFGKYQIVEQRTVSHPLHFGVGNTIIGGTVLKRKLMKWIEILTKELQQ